MKTNSRICFILSIPLFPLAGSSFSCYRQALHCQKNGFEVAIVCPQIKVAFEKVAGVTLLDVLPHRIGHGLLDHFFSLFVSGPALFRAIKKVKPDILHIHNPPDIIACVAAILNYFLRLPYIWQINDPGPESIESLVKIKPFKKKALVLLAKVMEYFILKQVSGAITVNHVLREKMQQTRPVLGTKPFMVQYHIPTLSYDYDKTAILEDNNFVLYVGSLGSEILGLEGLISSFKPVWEKFGTKFLIIGDGLLKPALVALANKLGASDYIVFKGYLNPQEVPLYLKSAKLCVIPYIDTILTRVATPTKLFEYLKMAKAVVLPVFPGFIEIVGSHNAGLFQAGEKNDMIEVMARLLADDQARFDLERKNKLLAAQFSFEAEMHKIFGLYQAVLK